MALLPVLVLVKSRSDGNRLPAIVVNDTIHLPIAKDMAGYPPLINKGPALSKRKLPKVAEIDALWNVVGRDALIILNAVTKHHDVGREFASWNARRCATGCGAVRRRCGFRQHELFQ